MKEAINFSTLFNFSSLLSFPLLSLLISLSECSLEREIFLCALPLPLYLPSHLAVFASLLAL